MHPHKKYIYFETLDFSNSPITSGYSLPISVFKFKPVFDDGFSNLYSNQSIYWDFGDGQVSSDIEPTHYYTLPGWYNVSCYVLATSGEAFASSFSQSIYVKNYISDTIAVSAYTTGKIEEGIANRLLISRFNSWQSYSSVSAHGGYTIILNISGNNAPYLDADTYKNEKWIHLKATSRFLVEEYNVGLQIFEKIPVNSIKTLHNVELYAKISGTNIVLCDKNDVGSCFVGTSGYRELWYIDDLPKSIPKDFIKFVPEPPYIVEHPESKTVENGDRVELTVLATGTERLYYQWRKNGSNIAGATSTTYVIPSVTNSDVGYYDVVVTNAYGKAISDEALIDGFRPPQIIQDLIDIQVIEGQPARFIVLAK